MDNTPPQPMQPPPPRPKPDALREQQLRDQQLRQEQKLAGSAGRISKHVMAIAFGLVLMVLALAVGSSSSSYWFAILLGLTGVALAVWGAVVAVRENLFTRRAQPDDEPKTRSTHHHAPLQPPHDNVEQADHPAPKNRSTKR